MHYEIFLKKLFLFFLHEKTAGKFCHRHFGKILPTMAPKSALAPRLSRSIRVPLPPYLRMWCPEVTPKRRERPLAAIGPVGNHIVFVMRGFGKITIEKSWCRPFLPSWRLSAPLRACGPPTGPIPVPGRPYSGMRYLRMSRKAVPLAESIGSEASLGTKL